ncbi:MAG: hypothetical protein IJC98_08785 [Clostridia bacterium]|nr:hypothetical protein [Clostridia bacterium]
MKQTNQLEKSQSHSAAILAENAMLRYIRQLCFLTMIITPLLINVLLQGISVYIDTYISVYYPSTAVTLLQWVLYYGIVILTMIYQFAGFSILGYTILRYGVKKSTLPIILAIAASTIVYVSGIFETIYLAGINTVKNSLDYLIYYWIINYFLGLFSTFCVIFLCSILRVSFVRHGRLQIGIKAGTESREERKNNVLRRLYIYLLLMIFFFNSVPALLNTYYEVQTVGGPTNVWEWFTLLQPHLEIVLLHAMGYFIMLACGNALTKRNKAERERATA